MSDELSRIAAVLRHYDLVRIAQGVRVLFMDLVAMDGSLSTLRQTKGNSLVLGVFLVVLGDLMGSFGVAGV